MYSKSSVEPFVSIQNEEGHLELLALRTSANPSEPKFLPWRSPFSPACPSQPRMPRVEPPSPRLGAGAARNHRGVDSDSLVEEPRRVVGARLVGARGVLSLLPMSQREL